MPQTVQLSPAAKKDSIKNDELNHAIDHQHLVLAQRATIRPIYVETVRDVAAEHKGYLINVKLHNKATMASYKDILLLITYFDKTNAEIGREEIKINKLIKPNETYQTTKKVVKYKNTNYKVNITSLVPVN